jgi:hypothetical protein
MAVEAPQQNATENTQAGETREAKFQRFSAEASERGFDDLDDLKTYVDFRMQGFPEQMAEGATKKQIKQRVEGKEKEFKSKKEEKLGAMRAFLMDCLMLKPDDALAKMSKHVQTHGGLAGGICSVCLEPVRSVTDFVQQTRDHTLQHLLDTGNPFTANPAFGYTDVVGGSQSAQAVNAVNPFTRGKAPTAKK